MAALDFPASPTNGQVYTSGGSSWTYDSAKLAWRSSPYEPGAAITSSSAPTNPQNGDIWYDTDDGTTFVYYNDGTSSQWAEIRSQIATSSVGMVPITPTSISVTSGSGSIGATGTVTFTGSSTISLNTVFTSSYRHYRVVLDVPTASATGNIFVRFRNGTTDDATNTYYQYWTMKRLNGTTQDNTGGPSTGYSLFGFITNTNTYYSWTGDVISPAVSTTQTTIAGKGFGQDATTTYVVDSTVLFNTSRSFDGITFYTAGALVTGTVKIYGYN